MDEKIFISERFASVLEGIPVSLEYGGAATQLAFTAAEEIGHHDGHRVLTRSMATPDGKCRIEMTINLWDEAVEWYLTLINISGTDSERFSGISYMDIALDCPWYDGSLYPRIMWSRGSNADDDDFMFENRRMNMVWDYHFGSDTGRASDTKQMPYVSISASPDSGVIFASGFSGSWSGNFRKTWKDGHAVVTSRFSFPGADFLLHPGESVRLPAALMLPWYLPGEGTEADGAFVRFRRFIHTYMFPRVDGKPSVAPICLRAWGNFHMDRHRARLDNVRKHGLKADIYGIDAGWYHDEKAGSWFDMAGDWNVTEKSYPNGLNELSDACRKVGLGFSAWMELERVGKLSETFRRDDIPLLRCRDWALIDLGTPEGRDYLFGKVRSIIDMTGMEVFRTDFNVNPAEVFSPNDSDGRHGLTELRYYFGLYELLDRLREMYPRLIIDNCASGGRRLDYEIGKRMFPIMCRSDYFCCQKDFGASTMQNMTLCLSRWLPVLADSLGTCMQSGRTINVGDTYRFRSTLASGISIACPDFDITVEEAEWYRKMLADAYRVRPYMCRDFYPLSGASVSEKDFAAYQAHDPDSDSGAVFVFRRYECPVSELELPLRGIRAENVYILEDIDSGDIGEMSHGRLSVTLGEPGSCRVIFYKKK